MGNLHCHTTLSDGLATPEATAIHYRNAGYDFLAITDHQRYFKPENTDMDDLLIIPAMLTRKAAVPGQTPFS